MKKRKCGLLSLLLVMVMVLGMAGTAPAADTASVSDEGITAENEEATAQEAYDEQESASESEEEEIAAEIDESTEWRYHDTEDDPAGDSASSDYVRLSWTYADYDDSAWKTASGSFGAKNGAIANLGNNCTPDNLLTQYKENGDDIEAYFFRTTVTIEDASAVQQIIGSVTYDDSATIYINGTKIAGFYDSDATGTTNMEYYGSGNGSPVTDEISITDADAIAEYLVDGENTIAVEVHNQRATSSDIYFEMTSLQFLATAAEETGADETQSGIALSVGADETERNITWYYNASGTGTLYLAKETDLINGEMPSDAVSYTAEGSAANKDGYYSYQLTMYNLEENTTYAYQLVNGEVVSGIYTFETGTSDGSFTFALAGDPQLGAGTLTTDIEGWNNTLDIVSSNSIFSNINFLLSVGDQVNTAANEDEYDGFLEHDSLTSLALATVIGNHDTASAAYSEHFNITNDTSYGSTTAGNDYYFVYEGVLFLVLNSNNTSTAEHKAFMEEAIAAAEAEYDISWKVVTFHHSIYSVASHALEDSIISRREQLVPVFEELDIDVVLMGHDHVYARTWIMDGLEVSEDENYQYEDGEDAPVSVTNTEGILYVTVNSASGSKYYNIQTDQNFEYAAVMNQDKTPNISLVTVTDSSFTVTTYETASMTQVDTFTIYRETETSDEGTSGDTDSGSTEDGSTNDDAAGDGTTDNGNSDDSSTDDGSSDTGDTDSDDADDAEVDDTDSDDADDTEVDYTDDTDADDTDDTDDTNADDSDAADTADTGDSGMTIWYATLFFACVGSILLIMIGRKKVRW